MEEHQEVAAPQGQVNWRRGGQWGRQGHAVTNKDTAPQHPHMQVGQGWWQWLGTGTALDHWASLRGQGWDEVEPGKCSQWSQRCTRTECKVKQMQPQSQEVKINGWRSRSWEILKQVTFKSGKGKGRKKVLATRSMFSLWEQSLTGCRNTSRMPGKLPVHS